MKNYRRKSFITIAFLSIVILSSCTKDLDLSPPTTLSDASFWKTPGDFEKAANLLYFGLQTHAGGTLDGNSDLADPDGPQTLTVVVPQSSGFWAGSYADIREANRIIENYEIQTDLQSETARYAGEARFFRARTYFNLLRTYGGVPLITKVLTPESEELFGSRVSREEVMALIVEDLDWAITNLPLASAIPSSETGRVSRGAARALKSRAGLFEGTWAKYHGTGGNVDAYLGMAISEAEALISSGEYAIYTEGDQPYYELFLEGAENSSESILARQFALDVSEHGTTRLLETNVNNPTKFLADSYLCTDGLPIDQSPLFEGYDLKDSEFENRDPRMIQTMWVPGSTLIFLGGEKVIDPLIGSGNKPSSTGYSTRKFFSLDVQFCHNNRCSYDFMEFRYAEVLLNMAEALYERDGTISDSDLDRTINQLRDRVGMPHLTNSFVGTNGLDMLGEIRRERRIELVFEGFRYFDILRWSEGPELLATDFLGIKFTGTEQETELPNSVYAPGGESAGALNLTPEGFVIADPASNRPWGDRDYLAPLPLDELQVNPDLQQNPGW